MFRIRIPSKSSLTALLRVDLSLPSKLVIRM